MILEVKNDNKLLPKANAFMSPNPHNKCARFVSASLFCKRNLWDWSKFHNLINLKQLVIKNPLKSILLQNVGFSIKSKTLIVHKLQVPYYIIYYPPWEILRAKSDFVSNYSEATGIKQKWPGKTGFMVILPTVFYLNYVPGEKQSGAWV